MAASIKVSGQLANAVAGGDCYAPSLARLTTTGSMESTTCALDAYSRASLPMTGRLATDRGIPEDVHLVHGQHPEQLYSGAFASGIDIWVLSVGRLRMQMRGPRYWSTGS